MVGDKFLEVEWQFDAPDLESVAQWLRVQPSDAAHSLEDRGEQQQLDTYSDTSGWHLHHAGYTLRLRERTDTSETTLKALAQRSGGPVSRAEFTEVGPLAEVVTGDGPVGTRLRALFRGHTPHPLFTVATRRRTWLLRHSSTVLAEIALDDTTLQATNGGVSHLSRVEVEADEPGRLDALAPFVQAMQAACGLIVATTTKFECGLRLADLHPAAPDLGATAINPDDRAIDRAYAVLRRRFVEFLTSGGGVALGEDPEYVHKMRVATRRLRAAFRIFQSVLPRSLMEALDGFRWFAEVLGPVRDLDVQLAYFESVRRADDGDDAGAFEPLITQFQRQRAIARGDLIEALDSPRYTDLVEAMHAALIAGPVIEATGVLSREHARSLIRRRYRQFREDARLLRRASPHVEYHALRVRGKRLRYSIELFNDLFGATGRRALNSLRRLQDLLGELQDLDATDVRLRGLVDIPPTDVPPAGFMLIGRLIERHRGRSTQIVRAFPGTRRAVFEEFARLERLLRRSPSS